VIRSHILVALAALAPSAAAGPRAGQVVRVERAARGLGGTPRMCQLQSDPLIGVSGDCYGPAPQLGETIIVLDDSHVVASVRVSRVLPASDYDCSSLRWTVAGAVIGGEHAWDAAMGVIDVPVDPRLGRLERVQLGPTDWQIGVDRDGDGQRIVRFSHFDCDDAGVASSAPTSTCLEVTASRPRGGFERLRLDRARACP
jgi:hypothetical protein